MKSLIFLLLVFMFSLTTYGQGYQKLINKSFYWDVPYAEMGYICSGYSDSGPYRYSFKDDTLINDKLYSKIYYSSFKHTYPQPTPNCPPYVVDTNSFLYPDFFLREDTVQRKVWRYSTFSGEEQLIYNFALEQGDSLETYYDSFTTIDTVYNIVTNDGISRKKFELGEGGQTGYYIEGIGGAGGLFESPVYYFESGTWLLCVKDHADNVILDNYNVCYNFMTNISSSENYSLFSVSPNPFTNTLRIDGSTENLNIIIYNLMGYKVLSLEVDNNHVIDVSVLIPGIYLLNVMKADNLIYTKRILKIKSEY